MTQTITLENKHLDTIANALLLAELTARKHASGMDAFPDLKNSFLGDACRLRQAFDALTMARAK